MECSVFAIDENNTIIMEIKSEWHMAVAKYHGKRDSRGNRYVIIPNGKPVPFKRKEKELRDISLREKSDQDILQDQP